MPDKDRGSAKSCFIMRCVCVYMLFSCVVVATCLLVDCVILCCMTLCVYLCCLFICCVYFGESVLCAVSADPLGSIT